MKKIISLLIIVICFICAGCSVEVAAQPINPATVYDVPIIMYHHVLDNNPGQYSITPQEFENDLKYIRTNGYTAITISNLADFFCNKFIMPEKPIILTFDDCQYDNYTEAFPLLKKHNSKATFFIIGSFSERFSKGRKQSPGNAHLSFDNIREMQASGLCDMCNHSHSMHSYKPRFGIKQKKDESLEDYELALKTDALKTQNILNNCGAHTNAFAYPFGAYSKTAKRVLQELGFRVIVTTNEGMNKICLKDKPSKDAMPSYMFELKRCNRPHGKTLEQILNRY